MRITWTGNRPPTAAQKRAIMHGVQAGKIRSGDSVGPGNKRLAGAKRAYKRFHWGKKHSRVQVRKVPSFDQLYELGALVEVAYETTKGKERAIWVHKFTHPRPVLTATPRGRLGPIIGGRAIVTERGIEK